MPLATGPNVALDNTWTQIATGVAQVLVQLIGVEPVVIAIGSAAPAANSVDGHQVQPMAGRDAFPISGLTTEKVYARTLRSGQSSAIAVTKG